ncbi:hypothetical protein MYX84_03440 [Acidobacteria bacterium AH-259-O06]|nr:hypothetical protein [Acidobacteria bacterium AH-259-O06]
MPLLGKKAKETPVDSVYALVGGKFRDKLLICHDTGSPNIVDPKPWVDLVLRPGISIAFNPLKR